MDSSNNFGDIFITAGQKTKEKKYWLNQLAGDWVKSTFPRDFKINRGSEPKMAILPFELPGDLFQGLMKLSGGSDARIFILLASGVMLLLDKYTGNKDIVIGAPIFKHETQNELINTVLTLRNRADDSLTFKEWILQISKIIFDAASHQNYPLKAIVNQLNMDYNEGDFPLFDLAVIYENIQTRQDILHLNLNMIFGFTRAGDSLNGTVTYNRLLYREETIAKIAAHFQRLMQQAISNVECPLGDMAILSEEDVKHLLVTLNGSQKEFPVDKTIPELFEAQAAKNPQEIAVRAEDGQITYRELNNKANRAAQLLRAKGIQADAIVGLMVERSIHMVVGMMAILKAGGAFLPLAATFPQARKKYILADSGAKVVWTQPDLFEKEREALEGILTGNIVLPDDEKNTDNAVEIANLEIISKPTDMAYIIYTSGTTGKPKGIIVEHTALINFLYSKYDSYNGDFGPGDNCLNLTNISFDVSVCEIFIALVFGAAIVCLQDKKGLDPAALSNTIIEKQITFAYIPPGLLKDVINHLKPHRSRLVLNKLLAGVEPINDYVLAQFLELNPAMKIINGYGPTETTICATSYDFNRHVTCGENVPIGRPLANNTIVILDEHGKLFPFGAAGELCVSGLGLARGYLNNPGLTAEKFKFYRSNGSNRTYITGDLARWRPDENLEFLGRIDKQLKIRGYRVEPGEIENRLRRHPRIKDAVVIDRESGNKEKYLCAYMAYEAKSGDIVGGWPTAPQLIDFLAKELPDYMIPQYFVWLQEIPLTPNGKLNREALPDPQVKAREFVAPQEESEKKIAEIWKQILNLEKVSITDNFFEVGGNSLSVIKLKNQIETEFNREIPDVKLLEYPTISSFHQYLKLENPRNGEVANREEKTEFSEIENKDVNRLRQRNRMIEDDM